ncbi:recombinase family protein [Colwellia demingiae]|uniref:Recombinase family protein n=1 Tax=Colwellia demingiae TaxID=89401 RepID=A0A5C6QEX6_9GAMM|nr:recombinase family protein [Colwellia demingiae]TWX67301.1 recombinase family protein [Colwellia demingiae]
MLVGYARTSTVDQVAGFESQIKELTNIGCERIFQEQVSSVGKREQLDICLSFLRSDDVLIVTKLDRLARSVSNLLSIVEGIENKGCQLRILDMNFDTSTPQGKMMLSVFGAVAQFEREIMLERQREGIAKAKAEGKYKGRKPTAMAKVDEFKALVSEGLKPLEIMERLNIGKTSFYKLKQATLEDIDKTILESILSTTYIDNEVKESKGLKPIEALSNLIVKD